MTRTQILTSLIIFFACVLSSVAGYLYARVGTHEPKYPVFSCIERDGRAVMHTEMKSLAEVTKDNEDGAVILRITPSPEDMVDTEFFLDITNATNTPVHQDIAAIPGIKCFSSGNLYMNGIY